MVKRAVFVVHEWLHKGNYTMFVHNRLRSNKSEITSFEPDVLEKSNV